jgi:hypothetical protein
MISRLTAIFLTIIFFFIAAPSQSQEVKNYTPTNKICKKAKLNEINKKNLICLKHNKKYKWHAIYENKTVIQNITSNQIETIYNNVVNGFSKYKDSNVNLNIIVSPHYNSNTVDNYINQYKTALRPYAKLLDKNVTLVFFSEFEENWWKNKIIEIEKAPNYPVLSCHFIKTEFCAYGSTKVNFGLIYHMIGSEHLLRQDYKIILDHEAVHIYQGSNWKNPHPSCWINEGYATLVGMAHSSKHSNVNLYRKSQLNQLETFFVNHKSLSIDEWNVKLTKLLQSNACQQTSTGYSVGMLIFEHMYLKYDFELVQSFISDIVNKDYSLGKSLEQNIKISEEKFYLELSQYFYNVARNT